MKVFVVTVVNPESDSYFVEGVYSTLEAAEEAQMHTVLSDPLLLADVTEKEVKTA